GQYRTSGFNMEGTHFYYLSDAGREFMALVEYEIESGTSNTIYESDWDVMYSLLSEQETFRVIAVNEDGKNKLLIFDNATNTEIPFPEISDGDIKSVLFSDSEKLMRLMVGSSRTPENMYLYEFGESDYKKLTETLNPEINPDDLVSSEVIRYTSFDGLEIPAIYYKPKTASPDNPVPALVWVHGVPGDNHVWDFHLLFNIL
ncbi:hypothetical protein LCGC14_2274780, partial [marine sediment metagenome]